MGTVLSEAAVRRSSPCVPPSPPSGLVRRARLDAALERASELALTVVLAPAGWGKTTLLSSWAADRGAAWLSVGPEADGACPSLDLDGPLQELASGRSPALVIDDAQLLGTDGLAAIRAAVHDERGPLVVASRCDLDLGLPRLRVEGRLGELRGADLAFTDDELEMLLDVLGVELDADRRRQLLARTDGWAAGIRLAAVALQASSDPARFLDEFSGDDRVVADYLTDEVLDSLPSDVRSFLLRTSIVARLDVDLAAALTGRDDAAMVLDDLERQGVFVSALDRRGRCYRYHTLFAELLRARLRVEHRAAEPELHERAADWFGANGAPGLAVRHALAAGSQTRTRRLLLDHWLELMVGGHVPDGAVATEHDPRLALPAAHARLVEGDRSGALERLDAIDRPAGWAGHVLELMRAYATHDPARGRRAGEAATAHTAQLDDADREVGRAVTLHLVGINHLAAGAVDVAGDRLEEAVALAAAPGRERLRLECLGHLAAIEVMRGRLAGAQRHAGAALDLAHLHGWEGAPSAGWALASLGAIAWLRSDLGAAERRAEAVAEGMCARRDPLLGDAVRALRAHLRAAHGDEDAARTLLRLAGESPREDDRALALWLEALGPAPWGPATGDRPADVTARAMRRLRAGDPGRALRLVAALDGAEAHPAVRVSALLVEAVARDALGQPGTAVALERALDVVEADGVRRPFAAAGEPLHHVLRAHAGLRDAGAPLIAEMLDSLPPASDGPARGSTEPLSERERAVLRLLPTILANSEIAGELFVSVNTIKTHVRSIYRKLGVGSRREAVTRARQLGLL